MLNSKNRFERRHFSTLSKISKGAIITLSGTIAGKGLLFFYTIFLAKILGVSDLGLYFLGITIVGFLTVLCTLGLNVGVVRFTSIYSGRNDLSRMKGTVLISSVIVLLPSLVIVGIIFLFGDVISITIFHKPKLAIVIKLLSLSIPFNSLMQIFLASTRGLKLMQYTAYVENLAWVGLRFLFTVFFFYGLRLGLKGVVSAYITSSIFAAGLAFYYASKLIPLVDRKITSIFDARSLLKFSIPMVFSILLYSLMSQVDILMLGLFVSSAKIGIYSVAVRIIALAIVISQAFTPIFNSFIAELHDKKELVKLSNLLKVITRWNITISFPIFLSLLFFPGFFLHIFGKEFIQGSNCLSILVIAHIFNSISGLPSSIIFMSGRSDITLKNNLAILIINGVLNYLLIPRYGIIGAAFATGTSFILLAIIRITAVYCLMKIHPFMVDLWKPIMAGFISLVIILFLQRNLGIEKDIFIVLLLSMFFLLYSSLIYIFKLNEEDIYIKTIIKEKLISLIR